MGWVYGFIWHKSLLVSSIQIVQLYLFIYFMWETHCFRSSTNLAQNLVFIWFWLILIQVLSRNYTVWLNWILNLFSSKFYALNLFSSNFLCLCLCLQFLCLSYFDCEKYACYLPALDFFGFLWVRTVWPCLMNPHGLFIQPVIAALHEAWGFRNFPNICKN